jgi:ATP-dependent DNA helicase RecG
MRSWSSTPESTLSVDALSPGLDRRSITSLNGVGPKVAERLQRLEIRTVQDLLFHLPFRYEDRTRVVPIGGLGPGMHAVVEAEIEHAETGFARRGRHRRMLLVRVADGTGALLLRFFHFSAAQQNTLVRGVRLRLYGEVRRSPTGLEMAHPETHIIDPQRPPAMDDRLTPIYPTTEGMHQLTLRRLTEEALAVLSREPETLREWLPDAQLRGNGLMPLQRALAYVHRPPVDADVGGLMSGRHRAQRRLVFEELLAHYLSLRHLRHQLRSVPAQRIEPQGRLRERFRAGLPFALTGAQDRVIAEIDRDLSAERPMLRLVQGDVGSGKTVVAACACLQAVEAGFQAAVMAPTEILAEQHYRNFAQWLEPLGVAVAWVSGRQRAAARREALAALADGHAQVAVGTHALFQEQVAFRSLALVVVDEQHRFGVHQRLALRDKGEHDGRMPHQLIMTATPIPRTLAMTAYADLDYSVIDELPPGRRPVVTVAIRDSRRAEVMERVAAACREGRQVYWVCTLIEESESLQAEAAQDTATMLSEALPALRVGLVHGRMASADKEAVMSAFKAGEIDLLVATTVIEVGVDVPNASLMIIENVERLGLSQIHQLRGRVGRGSVDSSCVLMYRGPLTDTARARLGIMRETTDGFEIARRDLELRGPGELLGTRQTGEMQFHIADLARDSDLVPRVHAVGDQLLRSHPERAEPLIRRWLGDNVRYAKV